MKSYKLKLEPFKLFEALHRQKNCFFLDSSLNLNHELGRYSFLGINPFFIFKVKSQDPFKKIREALRSFKISSPQKSNIPFLCGGVGYLAYDLGLFLERKVSLKDKLDLGIPDIFFAFYNTIIIIDHLKHALHICAVGFPEKRRHLARLLCESNFKSIYSLLSGIESAKGSRNNAGFGDVPARIDSNFSKGEYLSAIKRAKEYIRQGDIYQVNLSQNFQAKTPLSALEIYQRLRNLSPSCFGAYLDCGNFQILSSSPESFLRLKNGLVTTRPMKGTRPRSQNQGCDKKLKRELLKSAKDKAELTMIVDLERNDLGRVCAYDSVKVNRLRELEEYSTVFQTTASIQGRLHKDKDSVDLMRACFPGGSITGCPKIRAMQIIEELEPSRRSVYTGSLGYFSFSGNMDFSILIRTILKKGEDVYFGAGGGIVSDSDPEAEYAETIVKAKAMMQAIGPVRNTRSSRQKSKISNGIGAEGL